MNGKETALTLLYPNLTFNCPSIANTTSKHRLFEFKILQSVSDCKGPGT
jgi:hypothetical protein